MIMVPVFREFISAEAGTQLTVTGHDECANRGMKRHWDVLPVIR